MYCRRRRFSLVTVFLFFTSIFYLPAPLFNTSKRNVDYVKVTFEGKHRCAATAGYKRNGREETRAKKIILFYTTIFDRIPVFYPERLRCCDEFNCEITQDRRKLLDSDAVIFHGRDIQTAKDMPTQRTFKQRWIFYTMENPYNSKIVPAEFNGIFNWTMTYERRSDIYVPYGYYTKRGDSQVFRQRNHARGKDKLVTYVNSHCRTPYTLRENYIRALNKFIKVDAYGECGGIFGRMMCPRNNQKCQSLLKRYKFYLAFENAHCEDYVTEKYWDVSLSIGAVPIVFGGKSFKELCIPGSYIDASNFANVESLSKYLEYLDKNDTAYNEYFKWEKFYQKAELEPWPCRLCQMLHNSSLPTHTYNNFDKLLNPDIVCEKHLKHFENYFYY